MERRLKTTIRYAAAVFAGATAICWLTGVAAAALGFTLNDQYSLALVKNARGWRLVSLIALVLAGAPLWEETAFRLVLFKGPVALCRRFSLRVHKAVWAAISSTIFVALHYGKANPFPDNAFVALFFFGLAQCLLYEKTSRLWCPVLCHMLFNLANLLFLFILPIE